MALDVFAGVAELEYAYGLGPYVARLRGSNPLTGTNLFAILFFDNDFSFLFPFNFRYSYCKDSVFHQSFGSSGVNFGRQDNFS